MVIVMQKLFVVNVIHKALNKKRGIEKQSTFKYF